MSRLFRRRKEDDLERELRSDLEIEAEEQRERGLSPEAARFAARRAFGNTTLVKEEVREMWGWIVWERLQQDLRYGARSLAKNRGFTIAAVLTLALGIGANTAIFSLLNAVELRRLPVRDPQQLVMLEWSAKRSPNWRRGLSSYTGCEADSLHAARAGCSFSYPQFDYLRANTKTMSGVAAVAGPAGLQARIHGEIVPASAQFVSGGFFEMLGVPARLGRTIDGSDDTPGAAAVAVLSARYWESRFQSDPDVIGKTIALEGTPFTIVGVAAKGFIGLQAASLPDLWIPVHAGASLGDGWWHDLAADYGWLFIIGRLKDGTGLQQAGAEAEVLLPQAPGWNGVFGRAEARLQVVGIANGLSGLRQMYGEQVRVLMAVAGLVLLIACLNIANLLLARASARRKEIAVRLAIGCSRARLMQQLLTESALLAALGTAAGLAVGWWTSRALADFLSSRERYHLLIDVRPDPMVLAFTLASGCLAALLFGFAPALSGAREQAGGALRTGAASMRRTRFGRTLAALEMALALVLLIGAGLFVRTLVNLETLDAGFHRDHLLTLRVSRPHDAPQAPTLAPVNPGVRERLATLPGVVSATWASDLLLIGDVESGDVRLDGRSDLGDLPVDVMRVGPGFFETMAIPVLDGRTVRAGDCRTEPDAIWINRSFAAKYVAGTNLLGSVMILGKKRYTIAGIVGDTKYQTLRSAIKPAIYLPSPGGGMFILRTSQDPVALATTARKAVHEVNSSLLVDHVTSQAAAVDNQLFTEHMMARLSASFGLLALLMAAIGIYGVLAFSVARRTAEIAIRMSLGARQGEIVRMVLADGLVTALLGAAAGLAASWGLARLVSAMLFGVKPLDALTYAAATVLLIAVALAACYVPARRAMRVNPTVALKYE